MKDIQLLRAEPGDIPAFKRDAQEAFQKGFHIVEFINERHPGSGDPPEDFIGDGSKGMFEFRKVISR